jgi:hypothetical protein
MWGRRVQLHGDEINIEKSSKHTSMCWCPTCPSLLLMRAQASCLSLVWMPSRAIAASISTSASVATWWPRPLLPLWIMMHTCGRLQGIRVCCCFVL